MTLANPLPPRASVSPTGTGRRGRAQFSRGLLLTALSAGASCSPETAPVSLQDTEPAAGDAPAKGQGHGLAARPEQSRHAETRPKGRDLGRKRPGHRGLRALRGPWADPPPAPGPPAGMENDTCLFRGTGFVLDLYTNHNYTRSSPPLLPRLTDGTLGHRQAQ